MEHPLSYVNMYRFAVSVDRRNTGVKERRPGIESAARSMEILDSHFLREQLESVVGDLLCSW
jgi:hypothetical protein